MATLYSHFISAKYGLYITSDVQAYVEPESLVARMLAERPDAIKVLRAPCTNFRSITPDAILSCVSCLSRDEAALLCAPFPHPYLSG